MDDNIYEIMLATRQKQELERVLECNQKTEKFGLVLSQEEAKQLMEARKNALINNQRVEFGEGILPKIIYQPGRLCTSSGGASGYFLYVQE